MCEKLKTLKTIQINYIYRELIPLYQFAYISWMKIYMRKKRRTIKMDLQLKWTKFRKEDQIQDLESLS